MRPNAATLLLFLVSLALTGAGVLAQFRPDLLPPEIVANRFWLVTGGWGVLALGVLGKGL
ncbi:hypothetical protein [Caulobacter sp. 17J65-9]|uniref:hypothetical protein n=1 Tax=Caulobacter sp. 17J65-9 TaxID=2709382 RepID=UPI0013C90176|nr:hypothetical protein [Caulobacter sp. 17J65-9]NEX92203.1 hypothetical protein [Caulobacter sp. 17J65-9]